MKTKLFKVAAALGTGAILLTSFASAQTALAATCTGTVTGTSIAWAVTATGGTSPYTYVWTGAPNITGHSTVSFTEVYTANGTYTANVAVTDSATPAVTVNATCSATVTAVVTTPPPTNDHPMVKQPDLNINPNGKILIHGMKVTEVGTNTFKGTVWGITYTVNLVNPTVNKTLFLFKDGKEATAGINISDHLKIGDEVGVQGQITAATPLVINGQIVRNYSILKARPFENKGEKDDDDKNENKGNGMMNNSSNEGQKALLLQLIQQVQALQKQFQEKFGTPSTQ